MDQLMRHLDVAWRLGVLTYALNLSEMLLNGLTRSAAVLGLCSQLACNRAEHNPWRAACVACATAWWHPLILQRPRVMVGCASSLGATLASASTLPLSCTREVMPFILAACRVLLRVPPGCPCRVEGDHGLQVC